MKLDTPMYLFLLIGLIYNSIPRNNLNCYVYLLDILHAYIYYHINIVWLFKMNLNVLKRFQPRAVAATSAACWATPKVWIVASRTFWPTRSYWDRNWWVHSGAKLRFKRNLQFSCRDCSKNQPYFGPYWGSEWVQQQRRSCRSSSWSIINFHFNRSNGNCVTVITNQRTLLLYVSESLPQHLLRGFS